MAASTARLRDFPGVAKDRVEILQVNLGRLCNQACQHCHVDSSPARTGAHENLQEELAEQLLELLRRHPQLRVLDLTGGAPELNPSFRGLVRGARRIGRTVYVRHNITVQLEPGQDDLPSFFAEQRAVLYCSLPCYLEENVDRQRGRGAYHKSVEGLLRLNAAGFGDPASGLELHLVYNPIGPYLPPPQEQLEQDYKRELAARFGLRFNRLLTITNQPIHRFRDDLERSGKLAAYQELLLDHFNPATLPGLMCRNTLSVRWDGRLYDCDFNLVQDLPLRDHGGRAVTLAALLQAPAGLRLLEQAPVATAAHCFACTAGCGSSCGGALVSPGA